MAGKTISQRLALEGADIIKRQLEELGATGQKSLEQIRKEADRMNASLGRVVSVVASFERTAVAAQRFGKAFTEAGNSVAKLETATLRLGRNVALLGASVVGAATGLAVFVSKSIQAGDSIDEQAKALGLSTEAYQALGFAASEAGVKQGAFASAIKRFSKEIEDATQDSSKSLLNFAKSVDATFGGRLRTISQSTSASLNLIREAAKRLQAQLEAEGIKRPLFEIERQLLAMANGTDAAKREFEKLTGLLISGGEGIDQLRGKAESTTDSIRKMGLEFRRAADGSVDVEDALKQLADRFAAMPEGPRALAVAMDIFTRAAGPQLLPLLRQGRKGIDELTARLRELGLILSKDQIEASQKAATEFDVLRLAATRLKEAIGAAFAPAAGAFASGLTKLIADSRKAILQFVSELQNRVVPVITAFLDLLSGRGDDENQILQTLFEWRNAIVEFGAAVQSAVTTIILPAFRLLLQALDTVATQINKIFGTEFTGAQIGIALVIAKVVGAFTVLSATLGVALGAVKLFTAGLALLAASSGVVIRTLVAVGAALAGLVGAPALIAAATVAAAALIITNWTQVKNAIASAAKAAQDFFAQRQGRADTLKVIEEDLKKFAKIDISGANQQLQVDFEKTLAALKARWETFTAELSALWGRITTALSKRWEDFQAELSGLWDRILASVGSKIDTFVAGVKAKLQPLVDLLNTILRGLTQSPAIGGTVPGEGAQPMRGPAPAGALFQQAAFTPQQAAIQADQIEQEFTEAAANIGNAFLDVFNTIRNQIQTLGQGAATAFAPVIEAATAAVASIQSALAPVTAVITAPFQAAADGIRNIFSGVEQFLQSALSTLNSAIASAAALVQQAIAGVIAQLEQAVLRARALAQEAAAAGGFAQGGTVDAFAGGGQVRGRGTATSDSILARLSDGEFVNRARSVRYYGPRLFHALNQMRIPRDELFAALRALRGFSLGGLVPDMGRLLDVRALPGFAEGGPVSSTSANRGATVNLFLPDGRRVELSGDADQVKTLQTAAVKLGYRSAGRKPSRYS